MSQTRFLAWGHGYHSLNGNTGEGADGAGKGDEFIFKYIEFEVPVGHPSRYITWPFRHKWSEAWE